MAEWTWGGDKKSAVALTDQDAKSLVEVVVERVVRAVTDNSQSDLMAQYKEFVRVEHELNRSREREAALVAENTQLRARIEQLNGFLTAAMAGHTAPAVQPSYSNGATTLSLSSFPERFAASAPVPSLDGSTSG